MSEAQYYGTGRRKTSTARVFIKSGEGNISINNKPMLVKDRLKAINNTVLFADICSSLLYVNVCFCRLTMFSK